MEKSQAQPRIVRADARYRNSVFGLYFFLTVFFVIFFNATLPVLMQEFQNLDLHTSFLVGEITVIIFLFFFIAPASYLIFVGRQIKKFGRFPYPGMKVIRDTPVLSGKKAYFKANLLLYLGYCTCFCVIAGAISIHFIFQKIWISPLLSQLRLF